MNNFFNVSSAKIHKYTQLTTFDVTIFNSQLYYIYIYSYLFLFLYYSYLFSLTIENSVFGVWCDNDNIARFWYNKYITLTVLLVVLDKEILI